MAAWRRRAALGLLALRSAVAGEPSPHPGIDAAACAASAADGAVGACPAAAAKEAADVAETDLMQRAVSQASLASNVSKPDEYDCTGDGVPECGKWDYARGRCRNQEFCHRLYRHLDRSLDQSCRCRGPEYDCDGDGRADCGLWDTAKGRCANGFQCRSKYRTGDFSLDQSCRCRSTQYDCDGDGDQDCGLFNAEKGTCTNSLYCTERARPTDLSRDESCRCKVTDYDCNGDDQMDCGVWDARKVSCANPLFCSRQYQRWDQTLDDSCRCLKTDYDCSGDGKADCGDWDYQMSMCTNLDYCGYKPKFTDFNLDMSCRCRRCNDPMYFGTAFTDRAFQKPDGELFDGINWGTFRVWADHTDTCAPWVMPKDDQSLRSILLYARQKRYKVRISGAAHSAGGLVTDGKDSSVVVVSLAEYVAPGAWEFGMTFMPDGSARATVNAGWTQLHVYNRTRPLGYFMPAHTAGYFFQLGGIVANSVHGGGYGKGFVHSYVTRMRVMYYDGRIQILDKEEDLRYWRNSYGLLGIILGVELELQKYEQLQMYTLERRLSEWSAEEVWKFFKEDAEADIPGDIVPEGGSGGSRKSFMGQFFVDFINGGEKPRMQVYAMKANNSVDPDFKGNLDAPRNVQEEYEEMLNEVLEGKTGKATYDQLSRRDGSPPIEILGLDVNDLLEKLKRLDLSRIMSKAALDNIPRFVDQFSDRVNDGFFLTRVSAALAASYFVKPEYAFEAQDILRTAQLESLGDKDFIWNLPGEFRFVNVSDSAVLQPVPAGLWFNTEMIAFQELAKDHQAWKKEFQRIEEYWTRKLGAKPHGGKLWGFAPNAQGQVEPFSDGYACRIYSAGQKRRFNRYRDRADPERLFATGLGMKVIAPCR